MNKLEKWLWVNCTLKDNGQNSNSLYFYYKNLEIRYSDHMAKQSTGDLQIIKSSVFDSINYAVFIKGSAKIMIINASNTIDFISSKTSYSSMWFITGKYLRFFKPKSLMHLTVVNVFPALAGPFILIILEEPLRAFFIILS